MISAELARDLLRAGVMWQPAAGDRFTIDEPALAGQIFWISDLTIEVHHYNDQTILGFNGTTEWALDSVPVEKALWHPREDQLRALIGDRLVALERVDGKDNNNEPVWRVRASRVPLPDDEVTPDSAAAGSVVLPAVTEVEAQDPDVECAYAKALLLLA